MVPEYEERGAMVAANCNPHEWMLLSWRGRASAVAAYRAGLYVALHTADAQAEELRRDQKNAGGF
jgi:hypothetical protein